MNKKITQFSDGYLSRVPILQFVLVTMLFPLWGAAASLNDVLITQFKAVFELSDAATAFVQSAFYGGYFLIAIPAATIIKKTSYKVAIIIGLLLYIIGCSLFFPASHMATYSMFLVAIFGIAIGLSFLETSANTYTTMLGPRESATKRINMAQLFNPIGNVTGIMLGKYFVFTDGASMESQLASMTPAEAEAFSLEMLQRTLIPYKVILVILLVVLLMFLIVKFPKAKPEIPKEIKNKVSLKETLKYLSKNNPFKKGILAQFIYMALQTTVWSFTIRLALEVNPDINERFASNFMIYSFIAFFVGRLIANILMARFKPTFVLSLYSIIGVLVLAYTALVPNMTAVYGAIFVSVLFGPCWPTIYGRTLETVEDKYRETAGGVVVMAILGGAVGPVVQGFFSDIVGSLQLSFLAPMAFFAYLAFYFYKENKAAASSVEEESSVA
ncbi:L-fucose:H+ symporter permease [Robertmurraya yapensis]|uniref:L-fucose:H+ symporter permease n=2 Tax=Bacillaceae TaxID=186817 RepID=A0A3S0IMV5_9BACI|nr:L-fucose:H+ symporter permease [Bacillus yapensis]RTR27618.1 L-fucose:H+ symporter permease [Bacillus yapensis]TKS94185.1 L-fucose:H+ symporter permease [Bacillus yapensis]